MDQVQGNNANPKATYVVYGSYTVSQILVPTNSTIKQVHEIGNQLLSI